MAQRSDALQKLELLDSKLAALREILVPYNYETLSRPLEPGVWSPVQILHHILLAEIVSFRYIQKKIQYTTTFKAAGWYTSLRGVLLKLFFMLPVKFRAPKVVDVNRSKQEFPQNVEEIFSLWSSLRSDLHDFLASQSEEVLGAEVYKHSIAGRLTLTQMLDFFHYHFDRHEKQILKRLSN